MPTLTELTRKNIGRVTTAWLASIRRPAPMAAKTAAKLPDPAQVRAATGKPVAPPKRPPQKVMPTKPLPPAERGPGFDPTPRPAPIGAAERFPAEWSRASEAERRYLLALDAELIRRYGEKWECLDAAGRRTVLMLENLAGMNGAPEMARAAIRGTI